MQGPKFLRWTRRSLVITGCVVISYVGLTLLRAECYLEAASNSLDQRIEAREQPNVMLLQTAAKEGDVLGRIEMPRLGIRVAILEGTTSQIMLLGV